VADVTRLGAWFRTRIQDAEVLAGPFRRAAVRTRLAQYTPVLVEAASARWYRVTLPDGTSGYLAAASTEPLSPLRSESLAVSATILRRPSARRTVIDRLPGGSEVPVLGEFGDFLYVQTPNGRSGWLATN